jgi:hypothetical protein
VAVGFGVFFALRDPVAAIPFTGVPFFPSELSFSLPDILAVALGVPAAAAVVARLALRRVNISPLGVTRRITPKAPQAWRVLPLLVGLAELGFFVGYGRPQSIPGQILAFVPGFGLVMLGLVIAGPWLTVAGARLLARRTSRPATLIAARRLADDPRAGFRAVSGLVLALCRPAPGRRRGLHRCRLRRLCDLHHRATAARPRGAGHRLLPLHRGRDRGLTRDRRRHVPPAAPHHRPRSGQKRMIPSGRLAHRVSCWTIR